MLNLRHIRNRKQEELRCGLLLLFWRFDEAVDRGWWIQGFLARVLSLGLFVWEIVNYTFDFVIYFYNCLIKWLTMKRLNLSFLILCSDSSV